MSLDGGGSGAPATAVVTAVTVIASTMRGRARWTSVEAWAIETSMERGSAHRAWATLARAFGFARRRGVLVGTSLLSSVKTRRAAAGLPAVSSVLWR